MDAPETRYVRSGDVDIAFQVVGDGPLDLVVLPAFVSNIEMDWDVPSWARFFERLSSFSRLVLFDRRGSGMSGGVAGTTSLEDQIDDVRAVIDAVGGDQPVLFSYLEGCGLAVLYAAMHPDLVRALVLLAPQPRLVAGPGYEWAPTAKERAAQIEVLVEGWGKTSPANPWNAFAGPDETAQRHLARWQRLAMTPAGAAATMKMAGETDVRGALETVQCPTLVLRRTQDPYLDERHSRYVADRILDARYVEIPGAWTLWDGAEDGVADEIEHFLTGVRRPVATDRVLATVLFTDIVDSTGRAAELGDRAWRSLLMRHDELVREEVARHRGRFVKSLGDGALAVFDGPSRAINSATAISERLRDVGLEIRAGLHTGECELLADDDVGGLAVHIGARVTSLAASGEVLVSSTVRDLIVGSGHTLSDRGEHDLKGVPGRWRLFAVEKPGV